MVFGVHWLNPCIGCTDTLLSNYQLGSEGSDAMITTQSVEHQWWNVYNVVTSFPGYSLCFDSCHYLLYYLLLLLQLTFIMRLTRGHLGSRHLFSFLAFTLIDISYAQTAPNCPLWGPIYPAPTNVLHETTAIPSAASVLEYSLESALAKSISATNVSFHISVFSSDETLFEYNYASPNDKDALTAGELDKNTLFRIGSTGKALAVYTLLAATGWEFVSDPVTK